MYPRHCYKLSIRLSFLNIAKVLAMLVIVVSSRINCSPTFYETNKRQPFSSQDRLIKRLQDEITRLAPLEAVNAQKDILIRNIQQQLNQLMSHRPCPNTISATAKADTAFNSTQIFGGSEMNLDHLDGSKRSNLISPGRTRPVSASSLLCARHISNSANPEVTHQSSEVFREEPVNTALFERIRRERQILSGLVTQLQRDLVAKDREFNQLTHEINGLKRQINEKDIALNASYARVRKFRKPLYFE